MKFNLVSVSKKKKKINIYENTNKERKTNKKKSMKCY